MTIIMNVFLTERPLYERANIKSIYSEYNIYIYTHIMSMYRQTAHMTNCYHYSTIYPRRQCQFNDKVCLRKKI